MRVNFLGSGSIGSNDLFDFFFIFEFDVKDSSILGKELLDSSVVHVEGDVEQKKGPIEEIAGRYDLFFEIIDQVIELRNIFREKIFVIFEELAGLIGLALLMKDSSQIFDGAFQSFTILNCQSVEGFSLWKVSRKKESDVKYI